MAITSKYNNEIAVQVGFQSNFGWNLIEFATKFPQAQLFADIVWRLNGVGIN